MNIVDRICEKHKNDYNLISNDWMDPVHLAFGECVSSDIRERLERELDRLDIEVDPFDAAVNLKLDVDGEGTYHLTRSGELLYRFANRAPSFFFPNYDIVQAIAWTIYAIVSQNEKKWLLNFAGKITHGAFISCQSFSAKQQVVASRIMKSVSAQSVSEMPDNIVTMALKQLVAYADQFVESIPLFSYRPILEAAYVRYKEYKNKPIEKKLGEIAEDLFGRSSFENEISSYRKFVKESQVYADQVSKARKELTRIIYDLPIMVVSRFFTELNEAIVSINGVSLSHIEDLLSESVRFVMTPDKLQSAFAQVDSLWAKYTRNAIRQDFLKRVWEETMEAVDGEQLAARKICRQMRRELSRFCFVDLEEYKEFEDGGLLSWKQLVNLQERDLSMAADIRWNEDSVSSLQSRLKSIEEPNCWLCTPSLKDLLKNKHIVDPHNTQAVPLMDQRCVFALWVREYLG